MAAPTANAKGAADGFKAEKVMATQPNVKMALSAYLEKQIEEIQVISGKKSDVIIHFADNTKTLTQNKNNKKPNMVNAHQINRRCLENLPVAFQGIASNICLGQAKKRGTLKGQTREKFLCDYVPPCKEDSKNLARSAILGNEPEWQPDYMILTYMENGIIKKLLIEPMSSFLNAIDAAMYDTPEVGRAGTTLYICPEISMQRRGGKKDSRPDDIQFKFHTNDEILARHNFVEISLL